MAPTLQRVPGRARCAEVFVIGAAKAGTTALTALLSQHPGVAVSRPKEPRYFVAEHERGLEFYRNRYFHDAPEEAVWVDASNLNLISPRAAERIQAVAPHARLVVVLRDPVRRAHAHWWHRVSMGWERLDFDAAVADELDHRYGERLDDPAVHARWEATLRSEAYSKDHRFYLHTGYYCRHLERYLDRFRREQLKIVFSDDLDRDASGVMASVFEHIGVESAPVRSTDRTNSARRSRYRVARGALQRLPVPANLRRRLRAPAEKLLALGERFHLLGTPRPELSTRTAARLADHFRPHDDRLARTLGLERLPWAAAPP